VTSRDDGSDLDHLRTAVQALQLYAEGTHDDQELAKVHKAIVLVRACSPTMRRTVTRRSE
jgi:hypothetical protein